MLNAAQLEAVHHLSGPCLVLAGAGSGKTRVIAHKVAKLLQQGAEPARIAAITFTNKAAAEMRERVQQLVGPRAARELVVSTFHSLGVRMLRSDGARIGLKERFSIVDADDALALIRDAGGSTDNTLPRRWQHRISLWKNQGLAADAAATAATSDDERVAARVMRLYQEQLLAYQSVDFDDLIGLPLALLARDAEARAKWRSAFDHVLVDEVQDTNAVQYALLKALAGERGAFTAVGDDDQSIYGWRGATLDNLAQLRSDFPRLKVITLQQNYRSTGRILDAANALIANNPKLFDKKLFSELGEGEPVRMIECDNEEHEADRAVAFIQAQRGNGARLADLAVLYRANHQSKPFEQKLREHRIPYRVSGGQSFFDRAEIKDLLAWLRLIVNGDDDPAFLRAATAPKRGIGHQTLAALGEFAAKWKLGLFDAIFSPSLAAALKPQALAALQAFAREVNDFEHQARAARGEQAARAALLGWLDSIGYQAHLHDHEDHPKLAEARWANVTEFVDWVARRCGDRTEQVGGTFETEQRPLIDVAQTVGILASLAERDGEPDVVTLATLHAAKGLEWPHVMLAGVVEGLLPYSQQGEAAGPERLHEERRLMYVGITRAQRTLLVSTTKSRKRGRETVACHASRFIAEMKLDEHKAKEDPRERLKRLREAMAAKAAAQAG
jgi:ATP-dependent DNA helicase Rep